MSATQTTTPKAAKPAAAKPAKPAVKAAAVKAPPVATGPDGSALASAFETQAKAKLGKLEKVSKQNYFRLMKDGVAVVYVNASKKHARISLSFPVSDLGDVAEAVAFVERSIQLQTKADAK